LFQGAVKTLSKLPANVSFEKWSDGAGNESFTIIYPSKSEFALIKQYLILKCGADIFRDNSQEQIENNNNNNNAPGLIEPNSYNEDEDLPNIEFVNLLSETLAKDHILELKVDELDQSKYLVISSA